MKLYICNSLALGMLDRSIQALSLDDCATMGSPRIPYPISLERARELVAMASDVVPAVGHADTAAVLATALGLTVSQVSDRKTVRLQGSPSGYTECVEYALIGAYVGPRLPEGCTTLPEGATIEWWLV